MNVPISLRASSTILVIVVKVIKAAIRKKKTGKTLAMAAIRSELSPKAENPAKSLRVCQVYEVLDCFKTLILAEFNLASCSL